MQPQDDVAMVPLKAAAGDIVALTIGGKRREMTVAQDIPIYHKFALHDISKGSIVRKYGNIIGEATQDIPAGTHVHTHNINSTSRKE